MVCTWRVLGVPLQYICTQTGLLGLELLTGPAAASGPNAGLLPVEWVMKLLSKKKKGLLGQAEMADGVDLRCTGLLTVGARGRHAVSRVQSTSL